MQYKALCVAVLVAAVLGVGATGSNAQNEELASRQRTISTVHYTLDPTIPVQLILGIVGASLAVVAAVKMRRSALMPPELMDKLDGLLAGGKLDDAKELTAPPSAFRDVIFAGLHRSDVGPASVSRAITLAAENETIAMKQRAGRVMLVAMVIILVGLLGALLDVIRMLNIFAAMEGAANPADMADGVSIALVPICWGLALFAALLFAYWLLRDRAVKMGHEMEMCAEELLCRVHPGK
jgi:biopolymer transport protein ExbB